MEKVRKGKYISITVLATFAVVFITFVMVNFYSLIQNRVYNMQIDSMRELALQGSAVVEKNLESFYNSLYAMTEFLDEDDIHDENNMKKLQNFLEKETAGFQRMGIADEQGIARVTNGEELDISDRDYFQKCMNGSEMALEIRQSVLVEEPIVIAAVPIQNQAGNSIGILYGVIGIDNFHIYRNTVMEDGQQHIQIVDMEGNYIIREQTKLLGRKSNIFDGIRTLESRVSVEELQEKLEADERAFTEVHRGKDRELVYFSPLKLNDWCVVTVTDWSRITTVVDYILSNDVYVMIAYVIGVAFILCGVILYYSFQEKKRLQEFNDQLQFNERVFEIASSKADVAIVTYMAKSDQLRFINNTLLGLEVPEQIDNASFKFADYLPENVALREQIQTVFENMKQEQNDRELMVSFTDEDGEHYIRVQLTSLAGKGGEIHQCVGLMEDVTEETRIRKEAQLRETLLSATIGFMVSDLTKDRVLQISRKMESLLERTGSFTGFMKALIEERVAPPYRKRTLDSIRIEALRECYDRNELDLVVEYERYAEGGELIWVKCETHLEKDSETGHLMAYQVFRDITEQKQEELLLREKADRDFLTGLYNRSGGIERIEQELRTLEVHGDEVGAIVILDLDNFKILNDTLGHQIGDRALCDVAEILMQHFRDYDIICRLGGDEFLAFLKNIPEGTVTRNMKSLMRKLHLRYEDGRSGVEISASAGVVLTRNLAVDFKDLYQKADTILYEVKKNGKQGFKIYDLESRRADGEGGEYAGE